VHKLSVYHGEVLNYRVTPGVNVGGSCNCWCQPIL